MFSFKGKDKPNYVKQITIWALTVTFIAVDVYISLMSIGYNLFDLIAFTDNEIVNTALLVILQAFLLGGAFAAFYFAVYGIYLFLWKRKYKRLWFSGVWLHIHDKKDPKIGIVKIKQSFFDLEVSAVNIKPLSTMPRKQQTDWYYIGTECEPNGTQGDTLVCCYMAQRKNEKNKYGMHIFQDVEYTKRGFPYVLVGEFGDVFKEEYGRNADSVDKTGKLYFFKLPRSIKKQIFKGRKDIYTLDFNLLSYITENPDPKIQKEEFVQKLSYVLSKRDARRLEDKIKSACEKYAPQIKAEIDAWLAKMLCGAVLCDRKIVIRELDFLNEFFGTDWSEEFIIDIFTGYGVNEAEQLKEIKAFLGTLMDANMKLFYDLQELVCSSSAFVATLDGRFTANERKYISSLNGLFLEVQNSKVNNSDV